jgi:hypothetical protein
MFAAGDQSWPLPGPNQQLRSETAPLDQHRFSYEYPHFKIALKKRYFWLVFLANPLIVIIFFWLPACMCSSISVQ